MKILSLFALVIAADKENAKYRLQSQIEHFANVTVDGEEEAISGRNSRMIRVMDFQYGCHCKFDASIDEMGTGKAQDGIDAVCRQYKECLKCIRTAHGPTCSPTELDYNFDMVGGGYVPPMMVCRDTPGSCHRDTCECDRIFANDLSSQFDDWNDDYAHDSGFDTTSECIGNGRNRGVKKCCQNTQQTSQWVMFNQNRFECCADGSVSAIGAC